MSVAEEPGVGGGSGVAGSGVSGSGVSEEPGVESLIALAKQEDLGTGDSSASLLPDADAPARFRLIAKQEGVFAGRDVAEAVYASYDPAIQVNWQAHGTDGATIAAIPTELAIVTGPLGRLLSAERVVLNFLQRLCGIATITRRFVNATADTGASIYDTRKTTPGWRRLEKYAVRCGGGQNHRLGLYDAVMLKDNHLAGVEPSRLAQHVFDMLNRLPAENGPEWVAVEVDDLDQLAALLKVVGIDVLLLDNFPPARLREAVAMRDDLGLSGKVSLEASGGITLTNVRAIAETGVDRISIGALTHSATAIDLSLERV